MMNDFEFEETIPFFTTVGTLRELLKNYSDDTPITVCGTPGLFYADEEQKCILLETMDSGGYEVIGELIDAAGGPEYMDF